ncbi:MAG: efflux RND transporter periplasmic adaptor subunit [Vulcanibacillus sp.]
MKRGYYLLILIISIIYMSGCSLTSNNEAQPTEIKPVPVLIEQVQLKSVEQGERFIGKVKADKDLFVLPKVSGRVQNIYINQGDAVREGQVLMKIDDTYVNDTLQQAESSYKSALSNLNQAKERQSSSILQAEAQLTIAEDAYKKTEKNLANNIELNDGNKIEESQLTLAESTFDQARVNLNNTMALYNDGKAKEAELAIAQAAYDQAVINLAGADPLDPAEVAAAEAALDLAEDNLIAKSTIYASVVVKEAQLQTAQAYYDQAQKNLADVMELYNDDIAKETRLDQADTAFIQAANNLKIAKDSLENAKSTTSIAGLEVGLEQAELGLEQARRAVNDTKVVATISGQIATVMVEVGDMATQQQPVVQIINQDLIYVNFNVTENSLKNFTEGDALDIYIPSLDKSFEGKITFISPIANEQMLTFLVEARIDNKDNLIKSGMLVEGLINNIDKQEYLVIPTHAVLGTGEETYVYIIEEDGKAYKRNIEIKEMTTLETVITSGLSVNDKIVVKGQYNLMDGSEIEIVQEGEKS